MSHHHETCNSKSKFIIASVALLFCLVWALSGTADIKIVAVTLAFIYFLKTGIDTEMDARSGHDSH